MSWGRWQCRRGGADCLNGCYAVCGCGTEYRCGALLGGVACGDMLEAMARITPSQPNDAMARIASRRNRTISLDPNLPGRTSERFFGCESKWFSKVQMDSKNDWVMKRGIKRRSQSVSHAEPTILLSSAASF